MKTLKFVKEDNGNWYIDLPNWTGRHSALQMVAGADTLLDLMAKGRKDVEMLADEESFDGAECITLVKTSWINGADYILKSYDGVPMNHKLWLCNVTKFVLGGFPQKIYFQKI